MPQARNNEQLRRMLMPKIQETVEYLMNQIYQHNKYLIEKMVYDAFMPEEYQRTYEFEEAWTYDAPKGKRVISGNHVKMEFKYSPEELYTYDPPIHGSVILGWGEARDYLADLIYQGDSGPLYGDGPWRKKRDAWSQLIKELGKKNFYRYLEDGFAYAGLKVKRKSTARRKK